MPPQLSADSLKGSHEEHTSNILVYFLGSSIANSYPEKLAASSRQPVFNLPILCTGVQIDIPRKQSTSSAAVVLFK
jgi:hypothetical protein